jgi:hypothetical protein
MDPARPMPYYQGNRGMALGSDDLLNREIKKINELQSSALLHRLKDLEKECKVPLEIIMSDRELRIKYLMCFELRTIGYDDVKENDESDERGELRPGNPAGVMVGPVIDFITCWRDDIESLVCVNRKAIEMLETWDSIDDFLNDWDLWFDGIPDESFDRVVYLGKCYHGLAGGHIFMPSPTPLYEKLNRKTLRMYWERAEERVEALRRIEEMKADIYRNIIRSLDFSDFTHRCWQRIQMQLNDLLK